MPLDRGSGQDTMIRDSISRRATHLSSILTDRRDLVDGINSDFLLKRAVLPTALDGGHLVCAIADVDDADTLAALAFASGREVIGVAARREAILTAIVPSAAKPIAALRILGVRHAKAVISLRRYIQEASSRHSEALRIVTDDAGGAVLALMDDRSSELSRLSRRDARALIGATDALAAGGRDGATGFTVGIAGALYHVIVEQAHDGRMIRFEPGRVDIAP